MVVRWTASGKRDLKEVHNFVARGSQFYAHKVTGEIRAKVRSLREFPKAGRIVPDIGLGNVRELMIYSYRIIYEIQERSIFVIEIHHMKRTMTNEWYSSRKPE